MRRLRLKRAVGQSLRRGRRVARSKGLSIAVADDHTLQLDHDTAAQRAQFEWMLPYVRRFLDVDITSETQSRSGEDEHHKHVYLRVAQALTPAERIALQTILGSDPMREWLNLVRVWGRVPEPIQLFETKPATSDEND